VNTTERPQTREFSSIQNYLLARENRLANLMDEIPNLSIAVRGMCEAILRICEEKGINPRTLKPRTKITSDGKIFIDLNLPDRVRR
jgi:hypothetical protein